VNFQRLLDFHKTGLLVFIGALIVMILPILNGGPFLYFDTSAYIARAANVVNMFFPAAPDISISSFVTTSNTQTVGVPQSDKIVLGGRSLYFGIFAYAGWATNIWFPVVVQSLTLSWLVVTLFRHLSPPRWEVVALLALVVLACLSSASLFAGLIMPDIWAGFMVFALALLWTFGAQMSLGSKSALFLILTFAALIHNSHLALLAALIAFFVLLRLIPSPLHGKSLRHLRIPLLALGFGIAGQIAYSTAVRVVQDAELIQRPFITAHLVDMGPGTKLIQDSCPESGFALCEFADRLPVDWILFLFERDPEIGVFSVASPSVQKALADEQAAFAIRTLMAEPVATLTGLAKDGIAQLWTLSIDDVALSYKNDAYIVNNFPSDMIDGLSRTRIYDNPDLSASLIRIVQITSALSAIVLMIWSLGRVGRGASPDAKASATNSVILILFAGLLFNALICGILASPYGRFQARLIWILPLIAVVIMTKTPFRTPRKILAK
jgi:hypothetical protein